MAFFGASLYLYKIYEAKSALAKCTSLYRGNGEIMENAPMVIAVTMLKGRSGKSLSSSSGVKSSGFIR